MQRDDLAQPREATPIARFIGASNAIIVNPITKKSEFFYDFVLRHSLYRPRDLMLIGGKIAQIPAAMRTQPRLRAAVDAAAGEIVRHYLAEMRGLTEVPDRLLFGLIPSNVLDAAALKRIAETYAARLQEKALDASNAHPFCALYRLGLLGVVRRNREQKDIQIFRRPHDIEHDGSQPTLPAERHYLIHPALDDIVAQASSDYIRAFHTRNVIGDGNRWREGKIFKCAAKGDLSRYSRVLGDPVVGEHFARYLGSEFEKCKNEVEFAALESGDSVVLVDDSADRVLSAARSLQRAVRRFQVPQDFRFGAAVGAIAFATTHTDGQSVRVPSAGIVIRAAARIEPHAAPGTILCTEEFLSELDEPSRLLFTPVTHAPLPGQGMLLGDDGVAVIRKNDHEEAVETRLFQAPLG
jgi:class 3 adenylate cyclase